MPLEPATANGHTGPATRAETRATDAQLAQIKRQVAKVAEASEERASITRDAVADFIAAELAKRDEQIARLQSQIADLANKLEQQTKVDQQVAEIAQRLDARQVAREEAKRGKTGRQGERGARGERGPQGQRGPKGKPANPAASIIYSWQIDAKNYRAIPFMADGKPGPELNLRPLFERYLAETNEAE